MAYRPTDLESVARAVPPLGRQAEGTLPAFPPSASLTAIPTSHSPNHPACLVSPSDVPSFTFRIQTPLACRLPAWLPTAADAARVPPGGAGA